MAEIRPFRALRYASDADLAAVTCPPYDVLSPEEAARLRSRSPQATARLILPEGDGEAKYRGAADLFATLRETNALREDAAPGFYVTRTEFDDPAVTAMERRLSRLGLLCALRLSDYAEREVLPHEHTLSKPKEDRLNLLRATNANFESIMALVEDPQNELYATMEAATQSGAPLAEFVDADGMRHGLWKVEDPAQVERIANLVAQAGPVYIADGHHRYETSLEYARQQGALGTDRPEAFLLTTLITFSDPGLVLLPTHRLVRGVSEDARAHLFEHLGEHFDVQQADRADLESRLKLNIQNQMVFGLVLPSHNIYQVTARDASQLAAALPADMDPSLKGMQVVQLQHLVLDQALGIPAADTATTDRLAYTRDIDEAITRVSEQEFDAALLLGRPTVEEMRDVSLAGQVMPQKSTFFYPKLLSGLVMRRLSGW